MTTSMVRGGADGGEGWTVADPFYSLRPPHLPLTYSTAALLDGSEGFDLSRGTWRKTGWKELKDLRKVWT